MMKIIERLIKHKYLVISFLVIIVLVVFLSYSSSSKNTPTPSPVGNFSNIIPGKSTPDDVKKILGDPLKQTQTDGYNLSDYKSTSQTRNNQVYYSNGTAQLVKEIVSFNQVKKITDVTTKYGPADNILYGPDSVGGFYLFVYPEKGVAYLGNPNSGSLLEVWYFTSTDIKTFISTWAKDYSQTPQQPVQ